MANKRIKDLTQTATTLANDDYVAIDGSSNGTRKIVKGDLVNDISSQVAGTYLDEANNLSDVASLDTSKLNLEVPDVGTAPNEVPLNGMLGSMAFQSSEGISVGTVEADGGITSTADGTNTQLKLKRTSTATGEFDIYTNTDKLYFKNVGDGNTFPLTLDGSKVGIGTSSPNTLLECYDNVKPVIRLSGSGNNAGATNYGSIEFYNRDTSGDGPNIGAQIHVQSASSSGSGGDLVFSTETVFAEGEGNAPVPRMTIDHNGLVGIGGSPVSGMRLAVEGNTRVRSASAGGDALLYLNNHNYQGWVGLSSGNMLQLATDNTVRWEISNSGHLIAAQSGVGIDFGSAASGTGTPITNGGLLDDYEAGTFTPQVADATSGGNVGSAATATGSYTKVGRVVHFSITLGDIDTTGMTSGNTFYIRNLPFVSSTDPAAQLAAKTDNVTFDAGIVGSVVTGQSNAYLVSLRSANTDVNRTVGHIASGVADILLSGSYIAA